MLTVDRWQEDGGEFDGLPARAFVWSASFRTYEVAGRTIGPRLNYVELDRLLIAPVGDCSELARPPQPKPGMHVRDNTLNVMYTIGTSELWIDGMKTATDEPLNYIITDQLPDLIGK